MPNIWKYVSLYHRYKYDVRDMKMKVEKQSKNEAYNCDATERHAVSHGILV